MGRFNNRGNYGLKVIYDKYDLRNEESENKSGMEDKKAILLNTLKKLDVSSLSDDEKQQLDDRIFEAIDSGVEIYPGSFDYLKQFKFIKYAVEKGQKDVLDYLDVSSLSADEKQQLDDVIFKAIDSCYVMSSRCDPYIRQLKFIKYSVEKGIASPVIYLDMPSYNKSEMRQADNLIIKAIDLGLGVDSFSPAHLRSLRCIEYLMKKGRTSAINYLDMSTLKDTEIKRLCKLIVNAIKTRSFKGNLTDLRCIEYLVEKGKVEALDYIDVSSLNGDQKRRLDDIILKAIDLGYKIRYSSVDYIKQFKFIERAVYNGQRDALGLLNLSSLNDVEKRRVDDVIFKAIDLGYKIYYSSYTYLHQFKFIERAVSNGETRTIELLNVSKLSDDEKQRVDDVIFKAIDLGYEVCYKSGDYVLQFKFIKYAADRGNIQALGLLDFDSVTDEELSQLSLPKFQCLKIYRQLCLMKVKSSYLFFEYFVRDVEIIEKHGLLLSNLFNFDFDLASELIKFDDNFIKNDLTKKQLQILKVNLNIESKKFKEKFKKYVFEHPDLAIEQIEIVAEILSKISKSNSLEMQILENEIADSLLELENPVDRLEKIEDIFLKNNLPTVGKVYKVFEIMHPGFKGFNFGNGVISPILSSKSNYSREVIIFADLIKSFMGSNNRSMNNYLKNLEEGNNLFVSICKGDLTYESLDDAQVEVLEDFVSHLNTLYNNTRKGKVENSKELTGNIVDDISFLKGLFLVDEANNETLPDRIIRMYCHFAGIDTLEDAKKYVKDKIKQADERGRKYAQGEFTLQSGDFVKGVGDIEYLGNILQNGSNAKEYLGSCATSDRTPLDTDVSIIFEDSSIDDGLSNTVSDKYGPIFFVLKNRDNRFIVTRRSPKDPNQTVDEKLDLNKLEVFYSGIYESGEDYGIRTGFASSEIDYIIVDYYDDRVGLEIALNGFYIPVVDRDGKLVFSPEDYDKLRGMMNGLSYYGMGEYKLDKSIVNKTCEIDAILHGISSNKAETRNKANLIDSCIREGLKKMSLTLTHKIDLLPGSAILFNTGSTGRYTNLPGDGDFDFMIQVDNMIYNDATRMTELRNNIIIALGGDPSDVLVVDGDIRKFKTFVTDAKGNSYPVEIDITFTHKTDKAEYASDDCVCDRLNSISSEADRDLVRANIVLAKKLLKGLGAYKTRLKDENQGGLGGIGVETWILQNGGTLYSAIDSFLKVSAECQGFEEFVSKYKLYNLGINHMADRRKQYPHNDYIENMNSTGYNKMIQGFKKYKELVDKGVQNPCEEITGDSFSVTDLDWIIDKTRYENSSEIRSDAQQILRAHVEDSIDVKDVDLGQTGYMYQYSIGDKKYLVKAGVNKRDMRVRPARACVQECASVLQRIISPDTYVDVKVFGEGNVKVSVQEMIKGASKIKGYDIIKKHTNELLGEYVCDYLLGNFDSDESNFIVDQNGVLRGIDKEQSFKYLLRMKNLDESLSLDFSFHPSGSRSNIYFEFFNHLRQTGLSDDNLSYLKKVIERVQSISDEEYVNMFKNYAYAYGSSSVNEILSKILQRKKYFEANINEFIEQFNMSSMPVSK